MGKVPKEFHPYNTRQLELSTQGGCLLWGDRVVVPPTLRTQVLDCLHLGHPGIACMKALAGSYVWWPKIDKPITSWVANCRPSQESWPEPPAAPVCEWELPRGIWSSVHVDFAGPFYSQNFLVVVDTYSKWVELLLMPSTTTETTIRVVTHFRHPHFAGYLGITTGPNLQPQGSRGS